MLVAEIKRSLAMAAAASHLSSLKQLGTQRSVFSDPRPSTPRELSLPALSATRASNMHWKWTWLNRSSTCSSRFISFSYCLDLIQKREDFCFLLYPVCLGLSRLLVLALCDCALLVCLSLCCLLYTSPSPRDEAASRMPSSA